MNSMNSMNKTRALALTAALALAVSLVLVGCNQKSGTAANSQTESSSQTAQPASSSQPAAAPRPVTVKVPAGTRLRVTLGADVGSKISQTGDTFPARLAESVVVHGVTVFHRGDRIKGSVIDAKAMGHFKGGARLAIRLERVSTASASYPIATGTVERTLRGKGKRSAVLIGGGAGLGALVGGLAGGGKGAAIGAAAGAGAGTAGAAATGNKEIVLPAGTPLTFRLERSLQVTTR